MVVISHPSDDLLETYSIGSCPEADLMEIESHVMFCATCAERLSRVDEFVDLIKRFLRDNSQIDLPAFRMPPGTSDVRTTAIRSER